MNPPSVSRRSFLQSAGFLLGLPAFDSLVKNPAFANASTATPPGLCADGSPMRLALLYVPNGVNVDRWTPVGTGREFQFNDTMRPLENFRHDVQVVSGLEHQHGWANGDGGGDHARASATIFTGARPKKTAGTDIRNGISADQVAARALDGHTRFPSLELSCDAIRQSGNCDSGYSCAYQFNVSWRSETQPVAPESNPRLVFERLFGRGGGAGGAAALEREKARQSSLLDFLMQDASSLQKQLGRNDQYKLEEYLTGVREMERRIQQGEKFCLPNRPQDETPVDIPKSYSEHIRLTFDMLALAFQTDSTRVATFMLAHDGSNRNFADIGITSGHHELSHHQNDSAKLAQIAQIDRVYMDHFAYFLNRLKTTKEANGKSLLDNSMVVYCSGLSDANRHAHNNLPVILAGRGGGQLAPGQHLAIEGSAPMTNLYVSLLNKMGVTVDRVGDSTGPLRNL